MRDTTTTTTTEKETISSASGFETRQLVRAEPLRLTDHPTLNENWLRERIVDDPSVLGIGDLRLADEGRLRDGRLELLLRDPASGRRLTVLIRVGPAEDGDLVRAIENWTIERTRYPEHEHFAVIVAEELPPRFLTAATTLGSTIPLSAMQVSALRVGEHVVLHFTVVIDRLPARAPKHVNGNGVSAPAKPQAAESKLEQTPVPVEVAAPRDNAIHGSSNGATSATATAIAPAKAPEAVSSRLPADDPWDDRSDVKLPTWLSDEPSAEARELHDDDDDTRGGSWLFSLACMISLVLCVAIVFGWVRSHGIRDTYKFPDSGSGDHFVYSDAGQLEWTRANPNDPGADRSVKIPYWLPAGLTAILPIAWMIRRRR